MGSFKTSCENANLCDGQANRLQVTKILESPRQGASATQEAQPCLPFTVTPAGGRRQKGKNRSLCMSVKRKILFDVTPLSIPGSQQLPITNESDNRIMKLIEPSCYDGLANNDQLQHVLDGSYDVSRCKNADEKQNCSDWSSVECLQDFGTYGENDSTLTYEAKVSLVFTNVHKKKVVQRRLNFNISIESSCNNSVAKKLSFSIESSKPRSSKRSHESSVQYCGTPRRVPHLQRKKLPVSRRLSFSSPAFSTQSAKDLSFILAAAIASEAIASTTSSLTPQKFQISHTVDLEGEKLSPSYQSAPKRTPKARAKQRVYGRRGGQPNSNPNAVLPQRLKFSPAVVDSPTLDPYRDVNDIVFRMDSPVTSNSRSYRRASPQLTSEFMDELVTEQRTDETNILPLPADLRPKKHRKAGQEPLMYIYRDPEPGSTIVPSPMPVYRPSGPIPEAKAVLPKASPVGPPAEKKKKKKKRSELPLHPMLFQLIRQSTYPYYTNPWEKFRSKDSS